ncbi:MAG TPA: hypothetical protein VNX00_04255 [Herbaspirillum sp.]|nr:hypothetical protein [Herbaspirillum sp.]
MNIPPTPSLLSAASSLPHSGGVAASATASIENIGLTDPIHGLRFANDMRDLIMHAERLAHGDAGESFFLRFERLITDHCYRVGIAAPALREVDEAEWVQSGIRFEPAQWLLRIDIPRLTVLAGSTICMLVADQLHKAEMTAVLIGQQTQLCEAVRANTLLTDDGWHQAKAMLAPLCDYPRNRYLLQNIARNTPLAASAISLWDYLAQRISGAERRPHDGIEALMSMNGKHAPTLHSWIPLAYLEPIKTSLAENYHLLANHMSADTLYQVRTKLPANAQRLVLPGISPPEISTSEENERTRSEEDALVFFRSDEYCEQIEILTLLESGVSPRGLDVVLNNLSQSLASQHCRLEAQPTSRFQFNVWLIRVKHLSATPITSIQLAGLTNEIKNEIAALHACRENYLPLFRYGCAAVNP